MGEGMGFPDPEPLIISFVLSTRTAGHASTIIASDAVEPEQHVELRTTHMHLRPIS